VRRGTFGWARHISGKTHEWAWKRKLQKVSEKKKKGPACLKLREKKEGLWRKSHHRAGKHFAGRGVDSRIRSFQGTGIRDDKEWDGESIENRLLEGRS